VKKKFESFALKLEALGNARLSVSDFCAFLIPQSEDNPSLKLAPPLPGAAIAGRAFANEEFQSQSLGWQMKWRKDA